MPPVECWTFFTLDSTTINPGAITAPESCAVAAQPPKPPNTMMINPKPTRFSLAMRWRGSSSMELILQRQSGSGARTPLALAAQAHPAVP